VTHTNAAQRLQTIDITSRPLLASGNPARSFPFIWQTRAPRIAAQDFRVHRRRGVRFLRTFSQ
jgi:hypothetical protein